MRRRPVRRFLAATAMTALAASGCSGGSGVVSNGSVSACYRAIPIARSAVHDSKAHLVGVHRVAADTVNRHLPAAARRQMAADDDTSVCVMAFKGPFAPGQVDLAPASDFGPYVLVLVSAVHLQLVASVLLQRLPRTFGGRTV